MNTKVKPPRWVVGLVVIGTIIHSATAADFFEDFSSPPATAWQTFGDASLFQWNAAGQLEVTWDSSRTNSYFYHPLGTILGRDDDFTIAFDLTLTSAAVGTEPGKSDTFELAVGLINLVNATSTNFFRGKGTGTVRNLFELDYFPDDGLGATIWPAAWSTNAVLSYRDATDYTLIVLPLNTELHVEMAYTATNRTLRSQVLAGGLPIGPIHDLVLSPSFTDYRVDTFAICSYSDAASTGSLLATGAIDNVQLSLPPRPVENLVLEPGAGGWQLEFTSRTNWLYEVEAAQQFDSWETVGNPSPGTGLPMSLPVTAMDPLTFWRIRATRP